MKNFLTILIIVLCCAAVISNCSEDKNPVQCVSHPEGWNTAIADNFHGTKVLETGYNSCKGCHGSELNGGKTTESCFDCHQTYPHPDEWNDFAGSKNHGAYIEANNNSTEYCKGCHGSDLRGGRSGISCYDCHPEGGLP